MQTIHTAAKERKKVPGAVREETVGDSSRANPKGRARPPGEPPRTNIGSAGGVALPKSPESEGGANSPSEPPSTDSGSAGGVALPNTVAPLDNPLPKRKKLPHEIPSWVQQGERHFITINCKKRNSKELIEHAGQLLKSAEYYEQIGRWYLWMMVIMPDHIHFIATFNLSAGLKKTVSSWKRYQTTSLGIDWQSDFFEHRLRNGAEFSEKSHYIRINPVRKGLVATPEEWSHILDRYSIDRGVALPKTTAPKGRVRPPGEPSRTNSGSLGEVALPKTTAQKVG